MDPAYSWYVLVTLIGAAVGATELVARYRDAPLGAVTTSPAIWYIVVNALASLVAFLLIVTFKVDFGTKDHTTFVQALVASFGAMVFFRSSLFSIKVGGTDVAVGPGILFQVLLFATDRACDRRRATPRSTLVNRIMQGVSFELARDALPSFCFELMQNVPASEQQQFRLVVDALASSKMRDSVKVLNLGLMLMNVVGSDVLRAAVRALGTKVQGPAGLEFAVLKPLRSASFDKAFPVLVDVAFVMSQFGTADEQRAAKQAVLDEIKPLVGFSLHNDAKMILLGLSLQQRVGDTVLLTALVSLDQTIGLAQPAAPIVVPAGPPAGIPATPPAPGGSVQTAPTAPVGGTSGPPPAPAAQSGNGPDPGKDTPAPADATAKQEPEIKNGGPGAAGT